MPPTIGGIGIDPQGQSLVVTISPSAKVYSDRAGTTLAVFPQAISARTSWFVSAAQQFTISAKFDGAEIAGPNGQPVVVQIDAGQFEWIAPTVDRPSEEPPPGSFVASSGPTVLRHPTAATIINRVNNLVATGGRVVLDAENHTIDQPLEFDDRPNVEICGQGAGATVLTLANAVNRPVIQMGDPTLAVLTPGVTLRDFTVDGNKANQTAAMTVGTPQTPLVDNGGLYGAYGIMCLATNNERLIDIEVRNCRDTGIRHQGLPSPLGYTRVAWWERINSHDNHNGGIEASQRFRQTSMHGIFCDNNDGIGFYSDHSEGMYLGVWCRLNGTRGFYIHNVQRAMYDQIHAYRNGGNGIYVVGLVDSAGSNWFSHNNNYGSITNGSDLFFDDRDLGYGISRQSRIIGGKFGAMKTDSDSSENVTSELYGIYFQDGMTATNDLEILDVDIGPTLTASVRMPPTAMPASFKLASAKRPVVRSPLVNGESTISRTDLTGATISPTNQAIWFVVFQAEKWGTYTKVRLPTGSTAQVGMTLGKIVVASYDPVADQLTAEIGRTLDLIANPPSTGTFLGTANGNNLCSLTASINIEAGKWYGIGVLEVGTTTIGKLAGMQGITAAGAETGQTPRTGFTITGQADLPAANTYPLSTFTTKNDQVYAVLVP